MTLLPCKAGEVSAKSTEGATPAVSLYIHWPYCSRICPYCDFNVVRDRNQASQRALFDAILTDLKSQAAEIGPRRLASVFFGGGTPSLLPPEWVSELITTARTLFARPVYGEGGPHDDAKRLDAMGEASSDIEITLEANPTDAEIGRYQAFRDAGINRLSLGVQSLDDDALKFLGRNHSAAEAKRGIETARNVFGRVSLDLIYARPDQTLADWRAELTTAAELGIEHISPYQLTIESTTAFGRAVRRKQWSPPEDKLAEAFYFETQDTLESLGFEAYEVSNHARGPNAHSAHNVLIWEGIDYIGVGPGAHGRLTLPARSGEQARQNAKNHAHGRLNLPARSGEQARQNAKNHAHGRLTLNGTRHATTAVSDLKAYIARVSETGTGHDREALSPLEAEEEAALLGMRLAEGLDIARAPSLDLTTKAAPLIADGFMALTGNRLRATPKGRVVLDRLLFELLS